MRSGASASSGYRAANALGGDARRFIRVDLQRFVVESGERGGGGAGRGGGGGGAGGAVSCERAGNSSRITR